MTASDPAAGEFRVGEPAAQHRNALPAEPRCLGVVRATQRAGVDHFLESLNVAAPAVVERDVQHAASLAGGVHHLLTLDGVTRQRLFAQHMQSPFERSNGYRRVQERGHGDADGVEAFKLDHVFPAGERVGNAVLLFQLGKEVSFHAGDGHNFDAGNVAVRLEVLLAGPTDAHNSHLEGCGRGLLLNTHVIPVLSGVTGVWG